MQTNKYLKTSIGQMNNFISNRTQPPEDLAFEFVLELRVSNLIIPAKIENNTISFPHISGEKGERILPLFTDFDEFQKYSTELEPVANDFAYYADLIKDLNFDAVLINCESESFLIDSKLIFKIPPLKMISHRNALDGAELKKLALNAVNDNLLAFIRDEDNFNNFDNLADILKNSILLNVVVSDEPLDEFSEGIVKRSDAGGFSIATTKIGFNVYGVLFTGLDMINSTADKTMGYIYYQLSNLFEIFSFILMSDMDGVIINPGIDDYILPRNFLLKITGTDILANPKISKASDYAFRLCG